MTDPSEFFAGRPLGVAVYERVREVLDPLGHSEVRTTRSQIAFRRRRGFAWLWRPDQYLARPDADVVLSVALARDLCSPRFKEVVHPSPRVWMHHLEVHSVDDLDAEVESWLAEAWRAAA
jgi:hypothetical protein